MANSTITMITSLVMIILFTVAIIGFSIGFASDNDADIKINDDTNISLLYSGSGTSMGTFSDDTNDTYSSIVDSKIETGSDAIKSPASFTLTWKNLFTTFGVIMNVIFVVVFGGNPAFAIFTTALVAVLGFMFALYIIKAWRGSP